MLIEIKAAQNDFDDLIEALVAGTEQEIVIMRSGEPAVILRRIGDPEPNGGMRVE